MAAKNFDRDLHFINTFIETPGDSTSTPVRNVAPLPRTDGVVYDDVGTLIRFEQNDYALPATDWLTAGVIMRRPEVRGVYRVKGFGFVESHLKVTSLVVGIAVAPASPTGDAAGETVPHWQNVYNSQFSSDIDLTLCIDNFGTISSTDYSARDILFYVGVVNLQSSTSTVQFQYNLSVQRLSVGVPEYESKYR